MYLKLTCSYCGNMTPFEYFNNIRVPEMYAASCIYCHETIAVPASLLKNLGLLPDHNGVVIRVRSDLSGKYFVPRPGP